MKYAWIENDRIRDICQGGNPEDCYTGNIAVYYDTLVPDEAQNGDWYIDGQWTPYVPTEIDNVDEAIINGSEPNVIE